MARIIVAIIAIFAAICASGCADQQWMKLPAKIIEARPVPVKGPSKVVVKTASKADKVLMYYRHILSLPPPEAADEFKVVNAQLNKNSDWENELHYALLLLRPGTGFRDTAKATEILQRYADKQDQDDFLLSALSMLLTGILEDHLKIAEANRNLNRQFEESQKQLHHVQSQINALKSIEKSIHERNTREETGNR